MFLLKKQIALSSNDDKRLQSIDLIKSYSYSQIECSNVIKQYKNDYNPRI